MFLPAQLYLFAYFFTIKQLLFFSGKEIYLKHSLQNISSPVFS